MHQLQRPRAQLGVTYVSATTPNVVLRFVVVVVPYHHERGALGAPSIEGKKCATKIFYNTTALRKAPRHGTLRVPHARYGPRTASVTPPYMFTRNVLNNLRNDDAQVLL